MERRLDGTNGVELELRKRGLANELLNPAFALPGAHENEFYFCLAAICEISNLSKLPEAAICFDNILVEGTIILSA
jgi:hypothetical protein